MLGLSAYRRRDIRQKIYRAYGYEKIPIIMTFEGKEYKFITNGDTKLSSVFMKAKQHILYSDSFVFFCHNKVLPKSDTEIGIIYEKYKDDDEFLYITVAKESTFGGYN